MGSFTAQNQQSPDIVITIGEASTLMEASEHIISRYGYYSMTIYFQPMY